MHYVYGGVWGHSPTLGAVLVFVPRRDMFIRGVADVLRELGPLNKSQRQNPGRPKTPMPVAIGVQDPGLTNSYPTTIPLLPRWTAATLCNYFEGTPGVHVWTDVHVLI